MCYVYLTCYAKIHVYGKMSHDYRSMLFTRIMLRNQYDHNSPGYSSISGEFIIIKPSIFNVVRPYFILKCYLKNVSLFSSPVALLQQQIGSIIQPCSTLKYQIIFNCYISWFSSPVALFQQQIGGIINHCSILEYHIYLVNISWFSSPVALLQQQIGSIIKAIHRQLKDKSIKNRQGCFQLLTELVLVLPGALSQHVSAIVPGIQFSLG